MSDISLIVAFLGGALSLLPACGPALLPAFFAVSFLESRRLVFAVLSFALGFGLVFLPFVFGLNAIVTALSIQREVVSQGVGVVLILFGLLSLFGFSGRAVTALRTKPTDTLWASFLLGLTFGFTSGACSGPIFGAIATLALTGHNYMRVTFLTISFLAGMFVPLAIFAFFIQKYGYKLFARIINRGVSVTVFGKQHTFFITNIIAGSLFIVFGFFYVFTSTDSFWIALGGPGVIDWFSKVNESLLR